MSSPAQLAISLGQYLRHKSIKHMIVHVTNHCNFRCRHCFVDFDGKKRDLSLESYRRLGKESGSLFWLDIGGGEPFVRKDLSEIVASFDTKVVHIPSNGSLIDLIDEQVRDIKRRHDAELIIGLSLDGLENTHDKIRGSTGNWSQVWHTYDRLRSIGGVSIKVITVINNQNVGEIIPLMHEVRRRGVDFHSVILMRGIPASPDMKLPPMEELQRMGPEIFRILSDYDYGRSPFAASILRNFHRYLWNVSLRTLEEQTQVVPCLAGRAHLVVWGDGKVSSCEMLSSVGDLKTQTLTEVKASERFSQQVQDIRDKKCYCTHNCAMLASIFFNPANYPNLVHQKVSG